MTSDAKKYRLLAGLSDNEGHRLGEVGDEIDTIPPKSAEWLLAQGLIEPADKRKKPDTGGEG